MHVTQKVPLQPKNWQVKPATSGYFSAAVSEFCCKVALHHVVVPAIQSLGLKKRLHSAAEQLARGTDHVDTLCSEKLQVKNWHKVSSW